MMEVDMQSTVGILETFGFILAFMLIFHAARVIGRYDTFRKRVRLSLICPELTDIEAETEDERLKRLLAEAEIVKA